MRTKIIWRDPATVISTGLTRCKDLREHDAVLIINPEKVEFPTDGQPFDIVVTTGETNEDPLDS